MDQNIKMKNLLFIIPHPDDEIVGCCSIIRRYKSEGKKIFLFFTTNGVLSKEHIWFWKKNQIEKMVQIRKKEMKLSVKMLELKNYFFQNIPTRTLKEKINETYDRIRKIIQLKKIDTIFCPAYEGGHQDHDVSNFICSKLSNLCDIYEFSEYNYFNKKINCNSFITKNKNQKTLTLSYEEKSFKKKCLEIYQSEKKNLNYIEIDSESFRPIINYDYSKPPHAGVLFYRRFSFFAWHPRVDNDDEEIIYNKIIQSKIFTK